LSESLRDRQILLIGGTGGLGAATTELLAAEQARLVVSYQSRQDRAQPFEKFGHLVQADITRAEDRNRLLDAAPEELLCRQPNRPLLPA